MLIAHLRNLSVIQLIVSITVRTGSHKIMADIVPVKIVLCNILFFDFFAINFYLLL